MKPVWIVGVLAVAVVAVAWLVRSHRADRPRFPVPGERVPAQVEVLNAVGIDGLARDATLRLRARGLDVVFFGNAGIDTLTETRVVARRGNTALAREVQEALGVGVVEDAEDPRLLLDVTVLLGRDALPALGRGP
jgi:hypothetical protein